VEDNGPLTKSTFKRQRTFAVPATQGETMHKTIALLALFAFLAATACSAQRPSPAASASCDLGAGKTVKTDYSSPRVKGRKIYGDLVPFGQVWRTGANEATTFVTSSDIVVGGTNVPAGKYTIFTVPNADKWSLVISKGTGEWGTQYPGQDKDLARVDMKVSKLSSPLENFTISYEKSGSGCTMNVDWETTRASLDIKAK
jgi:Protein of unknown function (DUF2911)